MLNRLINIIDNPAYSSKLKSRRQDSLNLPSKPVVPNFAAFEVETAKFALGKMNRMNASLGKFYSLKDNLGKKREVVDLNSTVGSYTAALTVDQSERRERDFSPKGTSRRPLLTLNENVKVEKIDSKRLVFNDLLSDLEFKLRIKTRK